MDAPVFPKVWEQVELQTINYTQSQHCVDMTSQLTNEARVEWSSKKTKDKTEDNNKDNDVT